MTSTVVHEAIAEAERRLASATVDLSAQVEHYRAVLPAVCSDWQLTAVQWLSGGVTVPPLAVTRKDGTPAVLKLQPPGALDAGARVMQAAGGDGYVRVLAWDAARGALLLERLGNDLWQECADLAGQVGVIVPLLLRAWRLPMSAGGPPVAKGEELLRVLAELGPRYGAAAPQARALAGRYAAELAATERPDVVCHGDPHANNVLRRGSQWALIDVDGFAGERAYDLSVVLRDACVEFEAAEARRPGDGLQVLRHGCRLLGELGGADPERIWRWAFTERVTSGLYLRWFGYHDDGAMQLRTAETIAAASSAPGEDRPIGADPASERPEPCTSKVSAPGSDRGVGWL